MSSYLAALSDQVIPIFKKFRVRRASFFGSVLRTDFKPGVSDVDFLVELADDQSLFDQLRLKNELEKKIGERVDVVEYDELNKRIKNQVLNSALTIL